RSRSAGRPRARRGPRPRARRRPSTRARPRSIRARSSHRSGHWQLHLAKLLELARVVGPIALEPRVARGSRALREAEALEQSLPRTLPRHLAPDLLEADARHEVVGAL